MSKEEALKEVITYLRNNNKQVEKNWEECTDRETSAFYEGVIASNNETIEMIENMLKKE